MDVLDVVDTVAKQEVSIGQLIETVIIFLVGLFARKKAKKEGV